MTVTRRRLLKHSGLKLYAIRERDDSLVWCNSQIWKSTSLFFWQVYSSTFKKSKSNKGYENVIKTLFNKNYFIFTGKMSVFKQKNTQTFLVVLRHTILYHKNQRLRLLTCIERGLGKRAYRSSPANATV